MAKVLENPRACCALGGINATLGAVHRFCPIFHSGPGCCLQTTYGEGTQAGRKQPPFVSEFSLPSTNMIERDVVFGGAKKLHSTVQGCVEVIDAEAYFILTGCTAGIIGEDIISVAEEFQEQGYQVYPVDAVGFSGDSYYGYEAVLKTFLKYIVKPSPQKNPKLVNLLGIMPYHDPFWEGNLEELTRILRQLGLEVNTFFTEHQGIENIRSSSSAALNIIVSPWILKTVEKTYLNKFGVPALRFDGLPVGPSDTSEFVRKVGEALKLDQTLVDQVIFDGEDYAFCYMAQAIGELGWKRFGVVGDANTVVGLTRFLANDYGFMPIVGIVTDSIAENEDKERIQARIQDLEYADAPDVIFADDQNDIYKALEKYPDVAHLLATTNEKEFGMAHNVPVTVVAYPMSDRLIFNRTYCGYRGCLSLLEDMYA